MTYDDMFRKAMEEGKFLYAAELAIGFGEGKASRAGAWSWADDAVKAASMAGVRNCANAEESDDEHSHSQCAGRHPGGA